MMIVLLFTIFPNFFFPISQIVIYPCSHVNTYLNTYLILFIWSLEIKDTHSAKLVQSLNLGEYVYHLYQVLNLV